MALCSVLCHQKHCTCVFIRECTLPTSHLTYVFIYTLHYSLNWPLKKLFIINRFAKVICNVPQYIYSWPSGGHGQWRTAINNVETSQVFTSFVSCSMAMQLLQWATETAAVAIWLTLKENPAVALWYNGWHKPEKIIALSMLIAYPPPYSDFLSSFNCAHRWRLHACGEFWHWIQIWDQSCWDNGHCSFKLWNIMKQHLQP